MKLIEGFQLLATSPDGVALLRELILSLAMQGKLVQQDPTDEPASALLRRIAAEKARLVSKNKIRASKIGAGVAEIETLCVLPNGWQWTALGYVACKLTDGSHNPPKDAGFGYPMLSSQNVLDGDIDFSAPSRYLGDSDFIAEHSRTRAEVGDVLLTIVGSLGRSAVVPDNAPQFALQRSVAVIQSRLNPHFLSLQLRSPLARQYYLEHGKGTAQKGIYLGRLGSMPVVVPPLAEQVRIVAKVDELMLLCDELERRGRLESEQHARLTSTLFDALAASESSHALAENWSRVAAHFDLLLDRPEAVDALERAIGHMAVRGLLVAQDPTDVPAKALLAEIQAKKAQLIAEGKVKREKDLPIIRDEEAPFALPDGWAWARFPELGEFGRGKSKHRPRNDPTLFSPGVYPLIQTGDVARADRVIERFNAQYSESGLAQSRLWPAGTLCITIAANIADSAILGFDACFPDSVVGFVPVGELVDARYVLTFIETAKDDLTAFAPSTAQKNINLEILNNVLIPVPPRNEMLRIVARVEELRNLCGALRARLIARQKCQARFAEALAEQAASTAPLVGQTDDLAAAA